MTITLYSLGSNGSGQLGLNHTEDVSTPQFVMTIPSSSSPSSGPISISAGGNHTLLLLPDRPSPLISGLLPFKTPPVTSSPSEFTPLLLPASRFHTTSSTWTTSHLATSTHLYSIGNGPKGELGLGPSTLQAPDLSPVPNFPPPNTTITQLSSSMSHTACVLSNGQVYAWGAGRKGQIGLPALPAVYCPRLVEGVPFAVTKVICGKEFTVLLGSPSTGEMLILGSDKFGIKSNAPTAVKGWKDAGAGWGSVFILKENGEVISWGRNDHGQMVPEGLRKAKMMAVGSEHVVAVTEHDGNVLAWGWGEHGNCGPEGIGSNGDGKAFGKHTIYEVKEGEEVVMVGAGCATSWFATKRRETS